MNKPSMKLVIKVQRQWRAQIQFIKSKFQIFAQAWNSFCEKVKNEELNSKKKKYTLYMPYIREYFLSPIPTKITIRIHVIKYGKLFVKDRLWLMCKNEQACKKFQVLLFTSALY